MNWQKVARPKIKALPWTGDEATRPRCTVRACQRPAYYLIALRLVTGGREGQRKELRCRAHGQTFAEHKGLTLPAA